MSDGELGIENSCSEHYKDVCFWENGTNGDAMLGGARISWQKGTIGAQSYSFIKKLEVMRAFPYAAVPE